MCLGSNQRCLMANMRSLGKCNFKKFASASVYGAQPRSVLPWHSFGVLTPFSVSPMLMWHFMREPAAHCHGLQGERQTCCEIKTERWMCACVCWGGGVTCRCPIFPHVRLLGEGVGVWGWSVPRNIPSYEGEKKESARDLYFLQPDIKKITKHKSIRGENCIFSFTHLSLLHFLSVSLYLLSSAACVCVRVRVCLHNCVCTNVCVNKVYIRQKGALKVFVP